MTNANMTTGTTLEVIYGDTNLQVPATTSLEDIKNAMVEIFPELKSANVTREGNVVKFTAKAGTKGADEMLNVIYGDTNLQVPATTSLEEIKAAMVEIFPELKTAAVTQEGNTVKFTAKAGTKGMAEQLTVVYGDTNLQVPASTTLDEIKNAMVEIFPELKTANVVREGDTVKFTAKAGTKGMADQLTVVYGDTNLQVPATTSLEDVKNAMVEIFPELKTANVVREGDTIKFTAKAGTKGSDQLNVVYGDTNLQVPATTSLEDIKNAMVEIFPELKTANVVQEGDTVRFTAKAGTKGN